MIEKQVLRTQSQYILLNNYENKNRKKHNNCCFEYS